MSILDDVAAYLIANTTPAFSIATSTGGNLSIEQALDSMPNTLVTLYEQPGLVNEYTFSTGNPTSVAYERPNMQAISRSTLATTARANIQTVYTELDGLTNTTMSGTRYLEFEAVQAPFQLGRDDNERHMWSLNFNVKKDL